MDKRAAVRVPVRVRAHVRAHGLVIDGLVEDVSRSGLFMRAPKIVGLGATAVAIAAGLIIYYRHKRKAREIRDSDPGA